MKLSKVKGKSLEARRFRPVHFIKNQILWDLNNAYFQKCFLELYSEILGAGRPIQKAIKPLYHISSTLLVIIN